MNELKLRVQPDRTIVMEAAKNSPLLVTFGGTGKAGDCRGPSLGPTRQFYCYTKVGHSYYKQWETFDLSLFTVLSECVLG